MTTPATPGRDDRRGTWFLPAALVVLVGAWTAWVAISGRAFLPRHTAARDLPYAARKGGLPPQPFNRAMTDAINLIYPDRVFASKLFAAGHVALWNHEILCGVPHAANPLTAAFYPPGLLVAWMDPLDGLLWSAALHVVLAGVLFQAFLLAAGVRPMAALVGALGFALSGWIAAHLHNTPLVAVAAWVPLALAGVEWILRSMNKRGALAIAVSLLMQWTAGFTLFAVFGTLTLALYVGTSLLLLRGVPPRDRLRTAARIAIAAAIGILMAAPQILTTLDARTRSARTGASRATLVADQSFGPGVFSGLLLPRWLGDAHEKPVTETPEDPASEHASRHVAARLVLGRNAPGREVPAVNNFGERTLYSGGPVFLLAVAGILTIRRRSAVALLVSAAAAAALALGALPPDAMLSVTGLNVGAPARAVVIVALAVPAFAAFGLDRLFDAARPSSGAWAAVRLAALPLGAGALAAAVYSWLADEAALAFCLEGLRALGAGAALGVPPDRPPSEFAAALRPAFERLRVDVLVMGSFVLAAWIAVEAARRVARGPRGSAFGFRVAGLAVGAIVACDLGAFFVQVIRPVSRARLFEPSPAIEFLKEHSARGRIFRVSADRGAATADVDALLCPNLGMVHGIIDAQGYRELVPSRLLDLVKGMPAAQYEMGFSGCGLADAASPVVDLLSARWLIASRPLDEAAPAFGSSGLARVPLSAPETRPESALQDDLVVYENRDAMPYAFVVHEARRLSDADAAEAIRTGAVDFRRCVILDSAPSDPGAADPPDALESATARFDAGSVRIDATLSRPGYVVLTSCWDPGWRATLWHGSWTEDRGPDLQVVRANVALMAVKVPAGRHTITLTYWPTSLTIGIGLAGAAALGLLVWTLWPRRRSRPPPPAP